MSSLYGTAPAVAITFMAHSYSAGRRGGLGDAALSGGRNWRSTALPRRLRRWAEGQEWV